MKCNSPRRQIQGGKKFVVKACQGDIEKIISRIQEGVEAPRPKVLFEIGEAVRVKDGPFLDFNGAVEEVNYEKSRLRIAVTIFGRSTPVELDFSQDENKN